MRLLTDRRIILTEDSGGYFTEWYCTPPDLGVSFIVRQQDWWSRKGVPYRRIYKIELITRKLGELYVKVDAWQT